MISNQLNLPQPFVDAVSTEYRYTDKRYSATSLLKGVRETILQRRHQDEVEQDVADMVWMIFGTAVHSVLENAKETETQLKENKIELEMPNGYTLSGIFDLYDDSTGTVTDYKTASVWKVIYDEWDDYRKQLLIYAYMLREMGFDAHTGEIVALLKDHSKTKAKTDFTYPQHPVFVKRFEFGENDFDEIASWLDGRFREIERCEALPDDGLPVCTAEERWETPAKYAVYKNQNKRATRLLDTEEDAQAFIDRQDPKDKYRIEYRPGVSKKCAEYCSVCDFCNYWKEASDGE